MTDSPVGGDAQTETGQYDAILKAMQPGLLISINNADSTGSLPSGELKVEHSYKDRTSVSLAGPGNKHYRVHRDRRGDLVYSELTEDGLSYEDDVVSIEVIGIGG